MRRRSDWMRLQTGDRVVDLDDERHEGRVEGVRQGYFVAVRWDNGWHSTVPLDRLRRISTRNILHRANKNPDL